ncbi:MAG: phospholipid carrier-dependent glycosyltransferase [Candidatus Eremiobacteraeota bacterium]|nr:phospholipid carrier-dependent glycosyltransferase [Candidatus Eremiobacteraeota bacterium]
MNSPRAALGGILLAGLLMRLFFINADGFHNDLSSFEAWALTLHDHPLWQFYAKAGFADYPPGYFFILWVVGNAYKALVHADPTYALLKYAVKLPSILMDLIDALLIYALVRRFANCTWALICAAFFALNPAIIFVSAYWGQVDSVAGGFALGAVLLLLHSHGQTDRRTVLLFIAASVCLSYSILIKPPAVVLVPLFVAYAFAGGGRERLPVRLTGAALGIVAAVLLGTLAAAAFHAGTPLGDLTWLYERYRFGKDVYPYNTVNAFNLWSIKYSFWQSDDQRIFFFKQSLWGICLLCAAVILIVVRYVQSKTDRAFVESAALLTLGFFILSTRMHERYVYDGLIFTIPLIFSARRYMYAAIVLSVTLFANLLYSLYYLRVMEQHIPGVDPANLMPMLTRPLSLLNVGIFFYLGYVFLGGSQEETPSPEVQKLPATRIAARPWFSPAQGLSAMRWPQDHLLALGATAASFLICYVNYWKPGEKIFDEIYYARSGEEYLKHIGQFEYTHPPLSKLIITLSMILFGGLQHGDNASGWRFLNIVIGAVTVGLIYLFAKRLTSSTFFACVAAALLLFDGFHFVQSRIATPEITVAFFSLFTLYAFYRYWTLAQIQVRRILARTFKVGLPAAIAASFLCGYGTMLLAFHSQSAIAKLVAFLYFSAGFYLLCRLVVLPRFLATATNETSYADGSRVLVDAANVALETSDGGALDSRNKAVAAGDLTRARKYALTLTVEELRIEYQRNGSMTYATPEGSAAFTPVGLMETADARVRASDAGLWFWILSLAGGCLAASKWNGLFDFFVVWLLVILVTGQQYYATTLRELGMRVFRAPALWGNPRGFSPDVIVAAMLFVGASVYVLTYIPYFMLGGNNLSSLVQMQYDMYHYHATLVATHPYASKWWQWPLLLKPIAYYYQDFRHGLGNQETACCVAEILALPNPFVWLAGLFTVPFVGFVGWKERNKGYVLLVIAYLLQWLPWIGSPRLSFEYHFYPNLAIIVLCNAIVLQRLWQYGNRRPDSRLWTRLGTFGYLGAVVLSFVFFYPVLAGTPIPWDQWHSRMWEEHWVI